MDGPSGGANFARLQIVLFPVPYGGGNEDVYTGTILFVTYGVRMLY